MQFTSRARGLSQVLELDKPPVRRSSAIPEPPPTAPSSAQRNYWLERDATPKSVPAPMPRLNVPSQRRSPLATMGSQAVLRGLNALGNVLGKPNFSGSSYPTASQKEERAQELKDQ